MKRALSVLLVLLLIASLSAVPVLAAGGTGSGGGNGGGNGKSPLEVASVTINGSSLESVSSVPASGTINVSFTRGMDEHAASTITAIKIADAASKVSFDGDRTFSVTFSNLKPGKYTLVVGTAAQANNDNFLEMLFKAKKKDGSKVEPEDRLKAEEEVVELMNSMKHEVDDKEEELAA